MTRALAIGLTGAALMMTACVSHETHSRALGELNEARQANLQSRQQWMPSKRVRRRRPRQMTQSA